jgi:ATP-dependent DNA helicase PIF1
MRVLIDANSHAFTQWLLDIGHGRTTTSHNSSTSSITIPAGMSCNTEEDLITSVYSSMTNNPQVPSPQFFAERAILAARNDDIRSLNSTILSHLPGDERTYFSADSYSIESPTSQENANIPVEFLHTLNASGLPIAELRLKVGCPIIILRNIDPKRGLCNGTRATIISMSNRVLEIRLLTGDHVGEIALIPRITLSPSLTGLDFAIKLNRRQFPIQLAFALTINKSQGQSLNHIGIDLRKPVFAHGQLYVAFSRATSSQHIKVLLPDDSVQKKTQNVVYNEILLN